MESRLAVHAKRPASTRVHLARRGERRVIELHLGDAAPVPLTRTDADLITEAARMALERRVPLVAYLSSTGAAADDEPAVLDGWGRAARALVDCSGTVPLVFVVTGTAVAGPALLLGLADHVVFLRDAYAYVSGPRMVQEFTGVPIDNVALGGASLHGRTSGVASLLADDLDHADELVDELLGYLPSNVDDVPARLATADPFDRATPEVGELLPVHATGSYDVRDVITTLVDDGAFLELRANWATNMVTGLARLGSIPVGVVANQPQALAGTLDIAGSQKGARFVAFCDAFNLALVTVVDTPGFYPGKDLEWRGMIRHGAQLAFAYARATVPRVNLTLRKSYGGAYIVMDSKHMGNDVALALPSAEIAVMGAKGAVEILHRRASAEERSRLEADYEDRLLNPYMAAERGSIDDVIAPDQARERLVAALTMLDAKRERLPARHHDNTPL